VIVLDTNVLSELMKASPAPAVLAWMADQTMTSLFTTTVTQAEILYGLAILPPGRRRELLTEAAKAMFAEDFAGRVLPFDTDAARTYAAIAAGRRETGQPISHFDTQIAAMARSRGATLATRNVRDFVACGIVVVDPWQ